MNHQRLDLTIDIFHGTSQRACVLPQLTASQLIEAILQEFTDVEELGKRADIYHLDRADGETMLEQHEPLEASVSTGERLVLAMNKRPVPDECQPITQALYLREVASGESYKVDWTPAIVGRTSHSEQPVSAVAVDLGQNPAGQRVSRRHAQIVEKDAGFWLEPLADNPITISVEDGESVLVPNEGVQVTHGTRIHLKRSGITLKVLLPEDA